MIKDVNSLFEFNNEKDKAKESQYFNTILENIYTLYELILDDPIENIWYECISIIISYLQIISYMFDNSVSIKKPNNYNNLIIK